MLQSEFSALDSAFLPMFIKASTFFNYERLPVTDSFDATQARKKAIMESSEALQYILIFVSHLY